MKKHVNGVDQKYDVRFRATMRGLKRCSSCGEINGQRAVFCKNEHCELRQKLLKLQHPFDPIKLVSHTGSAFYSVLCKERRMQSRSFIIIREVTLAVESNSSILSRKSICCVDVCKYDPKDITGVGCKHIKACTVDPTNGGKPKLSEAEVYTIAREVLWNLNICSEEKEKLWQFYKEDEKQVPAVQRLNTTTFAVKCVRSKIFPAGRLHLTAPSDEVLSRKCAFECACKQLKIILDTDNSVVMQEKTCDHLLLVLAAVLSQPNGKLNYKFFINSLQSLWMPLALNTPVVDSSQYSALFGPSINIGGNANADKNNILIFDDDISINDNFPDLSDVILNFDSELSSNPFEFNNLSGDSNLIYDCSLFDDEDNKQQSIYLEDFAQASTVALAADDFQDSTLSTLPGTKLELSDCKIELMDEYQLTDQIDLYSDDISLPSNSTNDAFHNNNFSILSTSIKTDPEATLNDMQDIQNSNSLLNNNQHIINDAPPPIEMPTIAVVKKGPIKASEIVSEVKTRVFPHIPTKRALIVNLPQNAKEGAHIRKQVDEATEPSLAYSAWLDHIIETINDSIAIVEKTNVIHTFHVHEEMFSHFSKTFSKGYKRRLPTDAKVFSVGKYKGLTKYIWKFAIPSTARRIFSTKNISLEIERFFERNSDGIYIPYITQPHKFCSRGRKYVYPKLELYTAHIWFDCTSTNNNEKTGIKLEWLPNAFPKSHFGILTIEFHLGIRDPPKLDNN